MSRQVLKQSIRTQPLCPNKCNESNLTGLNPAECGRFAGLSFE